VPGGGLFQPGTQGGNTTYFDTLPDGPTVAFSNGGPIYQVLSATVQPDATYTLQVDIGNRNDLPASGSAYFVIGGTDILATGTPATDGNWSTYTATFTCVDTCSQVGDSIEILLGSSGSQGDFDNVSISVSVPEPSALLMLVLGLIGLVAFGWRRHLRPADFYATTFFHGGRNFPPAMRFSASTAA
jgi:hypothetical protein